MALTIAQERNNGIWIIGNYHHPSCRPSSSIDFGFRGYKVYSLGLAQLAGLLQVQGNGHAIPINLRAATWATGLARD